MLPLGSVFIFTDINMTESRGHTLRATCPAFSARLVTAQGLDSCPLADGLQEIGVISGEVRACCGEFDLDAVRDPVAGVGQQCVGDVELRTPERAAVATQVGEERIGVLYESDHELVFNLVVGSSVNGPVTHVGEGHQVVPASVGHDQQSGALERHPQADRARGDGALPAGILSSSSSGRKLLLASKFAD